MLKKGKRIWALALAVGLLAGQLASVAMAEDSPAVAQDSGQADSGRAASTGAVQVNGFTLAFADGTTPQEGRDKDYESVPSILYPHPQNGKELLLSGGDGSARIVVTSNRSGFYEGRIRLTNHTKVYGLSAGGALPDGTEITTHLALNGGGYSLNGNLSVSNHSRIAVIGGLHVNGDIFVFRQGTLTASGLFSQEAGKTIFMWDGSRLELKDQPSADWVDRLVYYDTLAPDGQGRAVFADGEFIIDKGGATRVSFPPVVAGVSPKGSGAPVSGAIVIGFNEAMDTSAGTVTLTERGGSSRTLTGGRWNSPGNTQFTIGYSGLANSTAYQVGITGFKSVKGFTMAADDSHRFTTAAAGQAAIPAASPPGGAYSTAQNVTLTCATSGAAIYYTLDGSDPVTNPNGTRQAYAAPIPVPLGSTLKAYATAAGWTDSAVLTEVYTQKSHSGGFPIDVSPSGGSSSGGSSSSYNAPLLRKTAYSIDPAEMRRLIAQADKNGWDFVRGSSALPATVKAEAWKLLADRRFAARTLAGGAVQVQLTFPEPWKLAEDMAVSGYTAGKEVDRVRALFEKWFMNPVRVIHLDHTGEFGQPVEIAAKVDLTGLDPSQLYFYSYDAKSNSYKPIENPNYRIDQNGYVCFTTTLAGDIIVSGGKLEKRG